MATEITIEVGDLYAEMYKEVDKETKDGVPRKQLEGALHNLYQQVERAREQRPAETFQIEEPEERE